MLHKPGTRYIVVREPSGFIPTIIGPITYPLTSHGYNQRSDGKSHIQAMRQANRRDIRFYRKAGYIVTIERAYPTRRPA